MASKHSGTSSKINRNSGVERFVLLIHGFTRTLFNSINEINGIKIVPLEILDLITIFCPKINGELISWNISNKEELTKIFNNFYKHGEYLQSDVYKTNNGPTILKWILEFYPNGDNKEETFRTGCDKNDGLCSLGLRLETSLKTFKYSTIIVSFRVSIAQIVSSQTTNIGIFNANNICSDIWSFQETQLKTLKNLYKKQNKIDSITLNVTINILRIFDLNKIIIYNFNPKCNHKSVQFDWKIDKYFWQNFKKNMKVKYESGIYFNMFLIEIQHTKNWDNEWCLRGLLKICSMNTNVLKVKLNVKMMIVETNVFCDTNYDFSKHYNVNRINKCKFSLDINNLKKWKWRWWTWPYLSKMCLLDEYDQITLRTFITFENEWK
eukprot:175032_1